MGVISLAIDSSTVSPHLIGCVVVTGNRKVVPECMIGTR